MKVAAVWGSPVRRTVAPIHPPPKGSRGILRKADCGQTGFPDKKVNKNMGGSTHWHAWSPFYSFSSFFNPLPGFLVRLPRGPPPLKAVQACDPARSSDQGSSLWPMLPRSHQQTSPARPRSRRPRPRPDWVFEPKMRSARVPSPEIRRVFPSRALRTRRHLSIPASTLCPWSRFVKKSLASASGRLVKPCREAAEIGVQHAHAANEHRHFGCGERQQLRLVDQQFLGRYGIAGL